MITIEGLKALINDRAPNDYTFFSQDSLKRMDNLEDFFSATIGPIEMLFAKKKHQEKMELVACRVHEMVRVLP